MSYNGHPVYKKEGYSYILADRYIFLRDVAIGGSDTEWYWAINRGDDFTDDGAIRTLCASGGAADPSLCPRWNGTGAFLESRNFSTAFIEYKGLNVSSGLCTLSDNYICISSTQSDLGLFLWLCFVIWLLFSILFSILFSFIYHSWIEWNI